MGSSSQIAPPPGFTFDAPPRMATPQPPAGFTLDAPPEKPSLVSDALKYSPVGVVKSLADAIRDPGHALSALLAQPSENAKLLQKAKDSYKSGDLTGAAAHFLNYLVPGGGALDDAGEDFANGDPVRGTLKTAGLASTLAAGAKGPAAVKRLAEPSVDAPPVLAGKPSVAGSIARKVATRAVARATGVPTPVINAVLDALKAGETEEVAVVAPRSRSMPAPVGDRPPPFRVEISEPEPLPDASPIRGNLPSGRVPGGIQNQSAPVPADAAPPAADIDLLNEISQAQAGKPFAKLTLQGQSTVKMLAAHVVEDIPAQTAPVVSQPPAPTALITKADIAKRALADEMLKSGSATPEMLGEPGAEPMVPDAKALKTLMRDLPTGGPRAIAKANYAGNQEPAQAAAVYEAAGRAEKSQALSQMLYDEGLSSRQVARWSPKAWEAAAGDRGMPTAFSKESQGEVIQMLRKMEKTIPKERPVSAPTSTVDPAVAARNAAYDKAINDRIAAVESAPQEASMAFDTGFDNAVQRVIDRFKKVYEPTSEQLTQAKNQASAIAKMDKSPNIKTRHMAEALQYLSTKMGHK